MTNQKDDNGGHGAIEDSPAQFEVISDLDNVSISTSEEPQPEMYSA